MGDPTPSAWENQTWNKVGDGRVIVGAAKEDVNSRKRLIFDDPNITDGTLLITGAEGKVSDMVGLFDNANSEVGTNPEDTPGKIQAPKRTRTDDDQSTTDNSGNLISATSRNGVPRAMQLLSYNGRGNDAGGYPEAPGCGCHFLNGDTFGGVACRVSSEEIKYGS
jgi:hypothetical protein